MKPASTIPRFWWLYFPILIILVQIVLEVSFDHQTLARMHSEGGPHEFVEAVFSGLGFLYALWLLPQIDWAKQKLVGWAVVIAALGTLYITGEELSWGQHILNWSTPEYWAYINDQRETNLHNTSDWLDQKPRLLLFIGTVFAGLVVPALRVWKPVWIPSSLTPLYPSNILVPTTLGILLPYLAEHISHGLFHVKLFERVSEVQELYLYYFVLLFLWDLRNRVISQSTLR